MRMEHGGEGCAPLDGEYIRFPPRWRNVLVPVGPPSATALGMTLYTASKSTTLAAQYALWSAVRLTGGRLPPPGPRERWTPALEGGQVAELHRQWTAAIGREPDGVAVYQRLQSSRQNLTLLVAAGARSMLVRVRTDPAELARERAVSETAQALGLRTFRVPRLVGSGEAEGLHWVGYELMSRRPHRPRSALGAEGFAEITRLVESVVPRQPSTPQHWRGAHGDLVPWNLRRGGGHTWLIDWEEAAWAPPGTDEVYLRAVTAALRRGPVHSLTLPPEHEEARAHWAHVVDVRPASDVEQPFVERMRVLLSAASG
ncbi:MAG: hypothetical protein U0Q15_03215 [Kineosporiaceae bacterium]